MTAAFIFAQILRAHKRLQVLIAIPLFCLISCGNHIDQKRGNETGTGTSPGSSETVVYITDTGEKYHLAECRFLKKSKTEVTLDEAIRQGYEACKVCEPPIK